MRRFLAGMSTCAVGLAALAAAIITLTSALDVALSDAAGSEASLRAAPPIHACGFDDLMVYQSHMWLSSNPACGVTPRTPADIAQARAYLIETASPGYTMTLQGAELAIDRLHPEFAVRLEHAIREARSAGLPFAGIFSAYRPPAFGVGGFSDKFNSLHTYGLAVDMRGIGAPGSAEAQLWHQIAAKNGVVCPYGPLSRAEWNHCQPTSVKMILSDNPLRETVTSAGPLDLDSMFEAGNPMIEDMASAADSLSRAAPTPVHALEAATKVPEPMPQAAARLPTKRAARVTTQRVAAKPTRHAKPERVAARSAQQAKTDHVAAKSGQHAKTERVAGKSPERAKTERLAAKSAQQAKIAPGDPKSGEPAKARQRGGGGRTVGAEETHKAKSKRA